MVLRPRNRKRKTQKKRNYKRSKSRTGGYGNSSYGTGKQYATLRETITKTTDISANVATAGYFNLGMFSRATQIASNFKWYRAKYVEYNYEPLSNTYEGNGALSVPYFYYVMNRTQDLQGYNRSQLEAMGAIGQKFTSKLRVSYKPNWCSAGLIAYTTAQTSPANITSINAQGVRMQTGWLSAPDSVGPVNVQANILATNLSSTATPGTVITSAASYVSSVIYNGHAYIFDQQRASTTNPVARCTITVHWEFKGPKVNKDLVAQLDNDPVPFSE